MLRKHREKVVINDDGKNVLKERSGNDDGGRERHVSGRQLQRVSQRQRLERGWQQLRGVLTALH